MCNECRQNPCHPRCPNALEPESNYYCSICEHGIHKGEEYIKNDKDEYIHYNCPTTRELVNFLGYEVQMMRGEDY